MIIAKSTRTQLTKTEATAGRAMVATKDKLATEAGIEVLELGGNVVDAAVAACFAVGVVEPASSGLGGGGYLVFQVGDRSGVVGFPMRGPLRARPDMYELTPDPAVGAFGWNGVVDDANIEGHQSVSTPGAVAGLCKAHEMLGRIPLRYVMAPAVRLAREGFAPDWFSIYALGLQAGTFHRFSELRSIFMPDGVMPTGSATSPARIRQAQLADVLEAIAMEGPDVYYKGDVARAIVNDMSDNAGLLTEKDFTEYEPFVWDGVEFQYGGAVVRVPPYACAGVTTAMTLKMLDKLELRSMGHNSDEMLHAYISCARLSFADRFHYMADPAQVDVPWNGLVSDEYIRRRLASVGEMVPIWGEAGDPWVEEGRKPENQPPASIPRWETGTTHLCTMDDQGNGVSLTNTLGSGFGSGVVARGTGIVLNNGMMWFDPVPGRVNSIGVGKYPLNNMTPALIMDRDGVKVAVGASGGRRITNCVTQLIVKMLDFDMSPQEAIDSPRVDCNMPFTSVDPRIDEAVLSELKSRGHSLQVVGDAYVPTGFSSFASPVAIFRNDSGLTAGVDTFHSAYAAGID